MWPNPRPKSPPVSNRQQCLNCRWCEDRVCIAPFWPDYRRLSGRIVCGSRQVLPRVPLVLRQAGEIVAEVGL